MEGLNAVQIEEEYSQRALFDDLNISESLPIDDLFLTNPEYFDESIYDMMEVFLIFN